MIWAEVYAGGIGGFVGRLRPAIEPPPHTARQQYHAWCRQQGVPWLADDHDYESRGAEGPIVAASDYMKVVPDQLAPWLTGRLVTLGTDGFGRSDNREHLRRHFEVNAESIAGAALSRLVRDGKFDAEKARAAFEELGVNTEKVDPAVA